MSEEQQQGNEQQAEQAQEQRRGRGRRGGRGFGRGRGQRRGGNRGNEDEFIPCTNLGRLVQDGKIKKLEDIYVHSIPIKEYQIVDILTKNSLKEECMCVKSVQKQTKAGQRTRFKCVVCVGDENGHIGIGTKVAKEVQIAMKGASIAARMNLIPVRRGYWGGKINEPHTLPTKITGKCGSVRMRFIPAPRGTGIIGAPPTKKILGFAGVSDIFSCSRGNTDTMENFVRAVYSALYNTYKYLTPDLWHVGIVTENIFTKEHEYLHNKKYEKRGHNEY